MLWPARAIGAATAAYSVAVLAKPAVLTKPTGLTAPAGGDTAPGRVLARGVAARDLVSSLALALSPAAAGVRLAGAVRVGADLADAIGFGLGLPDKAARKKSAAVAVGWAGLTTVALLLTRDD